jgi:hypothetical protein
MGPYVPAGTPAGFRPLYELVREIVGRTMVFVCVSVVFLCGPLLGAFRWGDPAPVVAEEQPLAGERGREVWGSLWEAAALAAEPPIVEPPPAAESTATAVAAAADPPAAGERQGEADSAPPPTGGALPVAVAGHLTGTRPGIEKPASAGKGTPGRAKGKPCVDDPVPGIAANGDGRWIVHRDIVQIYTRSLQKLDELGWSKRHLSPDGKADGMQIGGVKCNSDLHRAGIRSGDVVHSVNGREVTSIPDALFVYARVRKDDIIRVELTRKGQRKTFVYRMVG